MPELPIVAGSGAGLDLAAMERYTLGHMMGSHPLRTHANAARRIGALGLIAADDELETERRVTVAALPVKVFERRTKAGEWMAVICAEDAEARREIVCFPRVWDQVADLTEDALRRLDPLILEVSGGRGRLVAETARPLLERQALPPGSPLGDFVVLDLETTDGPEPPPEDPIWQIIGARRKKGGYDARSAWLASHRIVEVGLAVVRKQPGGGWHVAQKLARLVNPGCPIGEVTRAIHGISDDHVVNQPRFAERALKLAEALRGKQLVTYNGRGFDLPILVGELARAGIDLSIDPMRTVDVYDLVRTRYRGRRDRPDSKKLSDQCKFHGIPTGRSHSAGDDAAATGLLLARLVSSGWAPLGLDALCRGDRL